jgi:hypothetical protein
MFFLLLILLLLPLFESFATKVFCGRNVRKDRERERAREEKAGKKAKERGGAHATTADSANTTRGYLACNAKEQNIKKVEGERIY